MAACVVLVLAGCQPAQNGAAPELQISDDTALAQCTARGGEFREGGITGRKICFTTPKDAGKSCTDGSECSTGLCLARSRSCAPIEPLFGCNDILERGQMVTLCID